MIILEKKRVVKNQKLLNEIEKALKKCKNTGIKYLLLNMELNITWVLKYERSNRKIYLQLIKEFEKIPHSCRDMIEKSLKMNKAYNYNKPIKKFRTWSKEYVGDDIDVALEINVEAIKYTRKMEYDKAAEIYFCVYQNALKHPHPTYIVLGLNNAAWYRRNIEPKSAFDNSNMLAYYLGYYHEYANSIIGYFDTILTVLKINDDYDSYYTSAKILDFYYETLTKNIPVTREKYKKTVQNARKYCLVRKKKGIKRDEVLNSKALQNFLNDRIKRPRHFAIEKGLSHASLYRMLNGEKKTVKIKTLIQTVKALELDFSFKNPRALNYVIWCMKKDEQFELYCEKMKLLSPFELKQLILRGIFIQLPDASIDYLKLLSLADDVEKFIKAVSEDYFLKAFVNNYFESEYPFYRARNDLFNILAGSIGDKKALSELINLYTSVKTNTDIELLNIYFREYVRYSTTKWRFDVEEVTENRFSDPDYKRIASFCGKLNLSEMYGYLCTWFFEGKERKKLIEMF